MAVWSIIKVSELEGPRRLDAEYYKPEYIQAYCSVKNHIPLSEYQQKILHPKEIKRVYADDDTDIVFLLAQNIRQGYLDFSVEAFITQETMKEIQQNKLQLGDVIMTRTGANYGDTACYLGFPKNLYASAHCLIIRPKGILGPFLAIYLNTKIGRSLIRRGVYGTSQPEIAPDYIKTLPIPRFKNNQEQQVVNLVQKSMDLERKAKDEYFKAEQKVLKEIKWDELDLYSPKCWTIPLNRSHEAHRIDAEHFQLKYDKLILHLKKIGNARQIHDLLAEPILKGVTPDYDPNGSIIVVNSQHLGLYCLDFEATDRADEEFWLTKEKAHIKHNDVMIYATGAYIGRTNVYFKSTAALAGVDVLLVRSNDSCNPYYLAVFLNSLPGLMQSKQFGSGSGQAHIYPDDVASYWIHLPSKEFQNQIADLARRSYSYRQKSRVLLEQAIQKVEAFMKEMK